MCCRALKTGRNLQGARDYIRACSIYFFCRPIFLILLFFTLFQALHYNSFTALSLVTKLIKYIAEVFD